MITLTEKQATSVLNNLKAAKKPTAWLEKKLAKVMTTNKTATKKTTKAKK